MFGIQVYNNRCRTFVIVFPSLKFKQPMGLKNLGDRDCVKLYTVSYMGVKKGLDLSHLAICWKASVREVSEKYKTKEKHSLIIIQNLIPTNILRFYELKADLFNDNSMIKEF